MNPHHSNNPQTGKNKNWAQSFNNAFAGIRKTAAKERNFRIQICCGITAVAACIILQVNTFQFVLVAFAIFFVLAMELVNTSIEALTDLITQGKPHPLARKAKDTAAGAVLLASFFALVVAAVVATGVIMRFF